MATTAPGQRLGRYHLIEPLGGGPCGEVYRAKVVGVAGMDRHFAVKRIHQTMLAEPGVSAKLSQACRTYASLDHPRIARMSELGVGNGETFTVTDLVAGLDLDRLQMAIAHAGGGIPPGAALGLISAAARAVGYAHGRGVCHWGLCPTNLLATADGDVRVTDFGVLACRLGPRPGDDASLHARLAYLAPEQLIGEPVSAATDVFVLGVLAYELVAGVRPFVAGSVLELEQAILSARPAALELPRPVTRVIDRCLARSPFERFPDARALADALDAALRLAPLVGDRRDLGGKVLEALDHLAQVHESQLSGAFSLAIPQAPAAPVPPAAALRGRAEMAQGVALPLPPIPSPGAVRGVGRQMTVETAAVPPPSAVASPAAMFRSGERPAQHGAAAPTLVGAPAPALIAASVPGAPLAAMAPPSVALAPVPAAPEPVAIAPAAEPLAAEASAPPEPATPRPTPPMPMPAVAAPDAPLTLPGEPASESATGRANTMPTIFESLWPPTEQVPTMRPSAFRPAEFDFSGNAPDSDEAPLFGSSPQSTEPMFGTPGPGPALPAPQPMLMRVTGPGMPAARTNGGGGSRRALHVGLGALALAGIAFGAVMVVRHLRKPKATGDEVAIGSGTAGSGVAPAAVDASVRTRPPDAAEAMIAIEDAGRAIDAAEPDLDAAVDVDVGGIDAGTMAVVALDAAVAPVDARPVDARPVDAPPSPLDAARPLDAGKPVDAAAPPAIDAGEPVAPPPTGGSLVIDVQPRGARVFLDGKEMGKSPVTVPGLDGRHDVAAIAPGYKLYTASIDGRGRHRATLGEAPGWGGSGGIKVRCKTARRFYVFVDGKDTGMLCPTDRIGVKLGKHTVEIYDPITRTRRSFPADVVDTGHSLKIDVE